MPGAVDLTFTTVADVTDVEFSIGITGATVSVGNWCCCMFPVPVTTSVTFNEGATGMPPGDGNGNGGDNGGDNGDTGMPMPGYDNLSVSLTRVGESTVNQVNAGDDVVVNVAVRWVGGRQTAGAKIVFMVDPPCGGDHRWDAC